MKKRILVGALQYIGAIVLLACTVLFIYAFNAGKLPFMDSDYINARNDAELDIDLDPVQGGDVSQQPQERETAATYIAKLGKADKSVLPYAGIYGSNSYIAVRSLSGFKLSSETVLDLKMGYVVASEGSKLSAVYDSVLNDISGIVPSLYDFTFFRDAGGRPLFKGAEGYVYFNDGNAVAAEYDKYNFDKGLLCEYPSYLAGCDAAYTVFAEGEKLGLRRVDDNFVVIPANYESVYGVSEGYSIAVDAQKRLYLYNTDGALISSSYYVTADDGASATGYFFVKNGITRARTASGEEIMLRADGSVFQIPSGFSVLAYSDGAILLKGQAGYGYMSYNGKWLCAPNYQTAKPFNEGLAAVCDSNGLYGMIDLNGNTVIPHLFDRLTSSSDGVILAFTQRFGYYLLNKVAA